MPRPWTDAAGARSAAAIRVEDARTRCGVLTIVDTIECDGAGQVVLQATRGLVSRGVPVVLANFGRPGRVRPFDAAARAAGAEVVVLEQAHRGDFSCLGTLRSIVAERGIALVESHTFKAHVVAWRLSTGAGLPWLAYVHGWTAESRRVRLYNVLERRLLRRPDHVCAVAPALEAALRAAGRRGPVTVIRNAIASSPRPPSPAERALARRTLNVGDDAIAVVVVGRLSHEKGVDVLLDAVARANEPRLHVLVAGDGPEREALAARAASLGLAARVRFLGRCGDVRPLYAAADLVAIPSRSEGLPNVLLEAGDAASPVVATRVGAVPEVVTDGTSGWLVPPRDADALAAALVAAAHGPDRRERGRRLRRHVVEAFSAERRLDALLALHARVRAARTP